MSMGLLESIRSSILANVPPEAGVTKIEFEGPEVAIYSENPAVLLNNWDIVKYIAKLIRKHIVLRSDPKVRKGKEEARKIILGLIPQEAQVASISFDDVLGEVIVEVERPGLAIGKDGLTLRQVAVETCWRPIIVKAMPAGSRIINQIRSFLLREGEYRRKMLKDVSQRIYRPTVLKGGWVRVTALGGFREVGRSALLLEASESKVLIDCGVKTGSAISLNEFPRFDALEVNVEDLDAVIITHAHLDHGGFVPFLYKYGYEGPVYCTKATRDLLALLQLDYLDVSTREGKPTPYGLHDVKKALLHTIPLEYGEVADIAPDIRLTLHNAGHILGSAIIHLHIGEGLHNLVYTGDMKFIKTRLLETATYTFPRLETLIIEGTYGGPTDVMPPREQTEAYFINIINKTMERGGKILIPVLSVGRAQEIMLVLGEAMEKGFLPKVPVYIEGMVQEATAIHIAHSEDLARELANKIIYEGQNPFSSEHFIRVDDRSARSDIVEGEPSILMATSGMLMGGPAVEYLRLMAGDKRNSLIFVSHQIEGTLGRKIQKGLTEIPMVDKDGKTDVVKINLEVYSIEGFSGHSDRKQLLRYIERVIPKPSRIMVCHGEEEKLENMVATIQRIFKINASAPKILDSISLL